MNVNIELNWDEGVQIDCMCMCERTRGRKKASDGGNDKGKSLGKWWYGDLAEETVSHCLCGLSLRDQVSLIKHKTLLKKSQIKPP